MGNLFLSFTISIAAAIGLVSLSNAYGLDEMTNRIFPLIPILYAIVYNALDQKKTGKTKPIPPAQATQEMKAGAKQLLQNITGARVATDVAVSFAIKFSLEITLVALFLAITGQTFSGIYGALSMDTVGKFLRGDHPWLEGTEGLLLLALISIVTSYGTGLWIGYTSHGKAILEGVLAGAAVTFITAMTNMLMLYRQIEEAANQAVASLGYGVHVGFAAVMTLQVLLYGLWSGIAQRSKEERELRGTIRKSVRKPKK